MKMIFYTHAVVKTVRNWYDFDTKETLARTTYYYVERLNLQRTGKFTERQRMVLETYLGYKMFSHRSEAELYAESMNEFIVKLYGKGFLKNPARTLHPKSVYNSEGELVGFYLRGIYEIVEKLCAINGLQFDECVIEEANRAFYFIGQEVYYKF